jgi:hypothetical protein
MTVVITADWNSQIRQYLGSLDQVVKVGTLAAAESIAEIARDLVQKDTGSLHDTIDVEQTPLGVSINAGNTTGGYRGGSFLNERAAGTPVDYALDQEYGLAGVAHPYMTPAAEQGSSLVETIVGEAIREVSGG